MKAPDVISHLTKTISWYRQGVIEQQIANETSDVTYLDQDRQTATQIMQLGFDFARQQAQLEALSNQTNPGAAPSPGVNTQYQGLSAAMAKADEQVEQVQQQLDSLKQQIKKAPPRKQAALRSQIAEVQSEQALVQARRDVLRNVMDFMNAASTSGLSSASLRGQIEELARSVPAALSGAPNNQQGSESTATKSAPAAVHQQPTGMWGIAADLFRISRKSQTLEDRMAETQVLAESNKQLLDPLVSALRGLIQEGDQLANQAESSDAQALASQKQQLDALTTEFKQLSARIMPLSKQSILLDAYNHNLSNWRASVKTLFRDELRAFLLRLLALALVIIAVFGFGEAWRRAIFRYVHEARRRYQFLLLRRIVIWIAVIGIIGFTFASELGSFATFAGLLTAGVAVALQNVILSVAGYFFLIGKYGIRVGDRVQLAGVTGEVVDIGLVRMHLLEFQSDDSDAQPSGRIVAFSNSIVFQPTSGLFKQIPGTNLLWHELSITFASGTDYRAIRERITAAVNTALKDYRSAIENQMRRMEQVVNSISTIATEPKVRLHFSGGGIQVQVRFPVELQHAAEIDDHVIREIYSAIDQEPKLKVVGSGEPTLHTSVSEEKAA